MLLSAKGLRGYTILATDGEIGSVHDFLFHDKTWLVRYFVVDTGKWLRGRKALLSPFAFEQPDWQGHAVPTSLTKDHVAHSPDIDVEKPVSMQHEVELQNYYQWPALWPGGAAPPIVPVTSEENEGTGSKTKGESSQHLRSTQAVTGYSIQASDGEIGHVDDFILEEGSWIRYLVVGTGNWLPGKRVLLSPQWIDGVSWANRIVSTTLLREGVKNSPEYDPSAPVNRQYEERLYDYYGRPKYWK
jgi:hypothetical protein